MFVLRIPFDSCSLLFTFFHLTGTTVFSNIESQVSLRAVFYTCLLLNTADDFFNQDHQLMGYADDSTLTGKVK